MSNDDAQGRQLRIEVACALPAHQELLRLNLPEGVTVADALSASGIAGHFPELDIAACDTGIWGRPAARGQRLQDGDRVEVYRRLRLDPREARRRLAAHGRAMGQHDDNDV